MPKPTKVTFSSLARQSVITEIIASTASLDVFLVSPVLLATFSTHSALFILSLPLPVLGRFYLSSKVGRVKKGLVGFR